jgi:hypothetical protein
MSAGTDLLACRIFYLKGVHIRWAKTVEAAGDQEAISQAHELNEHTAEIEVWHLDRRVYGWEPQARPS